MRMITTPPDPYRNLVPDPAKLLIQQDYHTAAELTRIAGWWASVLYLRSRAKQRYDQAWLKAKEESLRA